MPFIKIAAIAVALAMDAFAVSIAVGMTLKKIGFRQKFRLAWHFGFFQAIMPIIGWSAGLSIQQWVENKDLNLDSCVHNRYRCWTLYRHRASDRSENGVCKTPQTLCGRMRRFYLTCHRD